MRLVLALSAGLLIWLAMPNAGHAAAKKCDGYPQSAKCCKKAGGTWVEGGSSGFCYVHLRVGGGLSQADCRAAGGTAQPQPDGSLKCVAAAAQ